MPRRGEYGDTTQRCAYCGKPAVSVIWSNYRVHYCSFSCMAADQYMCNGACFCCFIPLSFMMYIAILNAVSSSLTGPSNLFSVIPLAVIVWIGTAVFGYATYVGYSMSRETDIDDLLKELPPEHDYHDETDEY